jgi:hypothetical protein
MTTVFKQVNGAYNWWVIFEDGTEMLLDDYKGEE